MKKTNKIIAFFMAASIFIGLMPLNILADYQNLVSDIKITDRSPLTDQSYSVELKWSKPSSTGRVDPRDVSGVAIHPNITYDIEWRNGTKGTSYNSTNKKTLGAPPNGLPDEQITTDLKPVMDNGSVYSFRITPWHYHKYEQITNGVTSLVDVKAPYETGTPKEVLYVTDIELKTVSAGTELTGIWSNPTYLGKEIFTGYRFYYSPGGSSVATIPDTPYVDVSAADPNLIRNSDGTLEYKFTLPTLETGKLYAAKVEPLYNGTIIRKMANPTVKVNDVNYNIAFSGREYRTNDVYIKPALYLETEGLDYIRLYWNSLESALQDITSVEVYEISSGATDTLTLISKLSGASARKINFCLTEYPSSVTSYMVRIFYNNDDGTQSYMDTNQVTFDPYYREFKPYKPNILQTDILSGPKLKVTWEAFIREAFNNLEDMDVNIDVDKYVDKDVIYDIWLTDDLTNYDYPIFDSYKVESINANDLTGALYTKSDNTKTIAYNGSFSKYYQMTSEGVLEKNIEENKIYYIKIQATRDPGGTKSEVAYFSVYIPPSGSVVTNPITLSKPPFRVKKDDFGVAVVGKNSITVQWDLNWLEAFDGSSDEWYSVIGVTPGKKIVFGQDALALEDSSDIIYLNDEIFMDTNVAASIDKLKRLLLQKGVSEYDVSTLPIRYMNLDGAGYEIFTSTTENVELEGGYLAYFEQLRADNELWNTITPTGDPLHPEYKVTKEDAPKKQDLTPNTSYTIFFRAFVMDKGVKVYSYNPIYVMETTLGDDKPIDITPTATSLIEVDSTGTSITVKFKYSSDLSYDLRYSDDQSKYSGNGIAITKEDLLSKGKIVVEDGDTYMYYTINDLFPDTSYYAWIKSFTATKESSWSSPIQIKTKPLAPPDAPKGLSIISKNSLDVINVENSSKYTQTADDYVILEWTRVWEDTKDTGTSKITDGSTESFLSTTLKRFYATKFNNLTANKKYYARVKTVRTISRGDDGKTISNYTYVISLADNINFLDAVETEVPKNSLVVDGKNIIKSESKWSSIISVNTGKTGDEYDGDFNPDLYPLPETSYETAYDASTDTLEYIFRDGEKDSTGTNNYNVDQRFISSVINDKIYDYKIDTTYYNGRKVKNSKVKVPYSIFNALKDEGVTLTVKSDNLITTVDFDIVKGMVTQDNIKGLGYGAYIEMEFNNVETYNLPKLNSNEKYISKPKSFEIRAVTPKSSALVKNLSVPAKMSLVVENRNDLVNGKASVFYNDGGPNTLLKSTFANEDKTLEFPTNKTGTFFATLTSIPATSGSGNNTNVIYNLNSKMTITDLGVYNPSNAVNARQFNNIVAAVGKGNLVTTMNTNLSDEDFKSLGRSGMLISGTYVPKEKGISSLVKLYELKTKTTITPYRSAAQTGLKDFSSVSKEYQNDMLKAYEIGFFGNSDNIRPKENMTFEELFNFISIIIDDSGM